MTSVNSVTSARVSEPFILRPHSILAVRSFKPTNGEMTLGYFLEVFDKNIVHDRAAKRTDDWESLRRNLLRHYYSEARRDQGNKPNENRRAFLDYAALSDKARSFSYALREYPPHSEVTAFRCVGRARSSTQREDLHA